MAVETKTEIESLADIVRLVRENFSIAKSGIGGGIIISEEKEKLLTYQVAINEKGDAVDKCMESLIPQLERANNLTVVYKSNKQLEEEFKECLEKNLKMPHAEAKPLPLSGEYTFEIHRMCDGLLREYVIIESRTLLIPYEKRLREEFDSLAKVGLDVTQATYFFRAD